MNFTLYELETRRKIREAVAAGDESLARALIERFLAVRPATRARRIALLNTIKERRVADRNEQ